MRKNALNAGVCYRNKLLSLDPRLTFRMYVRAATVQQETTQDVFCKRVENTTANVHLRGANDIPPSCSALPPNAFHYWVRRSKVRELSAELLLLHDHASSLRETIGAGLISPCSLAADLCAGNSVAANSSPNPPSPLAAALLPHSASLPHLSRLLKSRGVASPPQHQSNGRTLSQSQSETAIAHGGGNRQGKDCRRHGGQTVMEATCARSRPQSAGVARNRPGNTPSRYALGLGPDARSEVATTPVTRTNNTAAREVGVPRQAGRVRPMSAPGRRPEGGRSSGGPHFMGPVEVNAGGDGRLGTGLHPQRTMLGGWSAQDVLDRKAGELSRGGLLCLVGALRENLGAGYGHNQGRGPASHRAPQLDANRGPGALEEGGVGRPDAQTLLREQTRRYNDLRVAYASLCRRLENGQRGVGYSRSAGGVGQAEQIKLSAARYGSRELGAKTPPVPRDKPETSVEGGRRIGRTGCNEPLT